MKSLVLAEKPSVGKELARVLGCSNMGRYQEGPDFVVTWALGHLVTLCPPDSYGPEFRHWNLRNLPMLPPVLNTMVIDKTKDQYELVKSLLDREDINLVIIATDAGREGELVARWILKQAGCTKPIKRLWISSQTDLAIKEGFANLKDGHLYDNLYKAAESRSYADWYIGYNVSRALSCHFDTRLSAGRVQTPTLALITQREDEIESFAGKFYWTLRADFGSFKASWYSEDNTVKIEGEEKANRLYDSVVGKTGKVVSVTNTPKTEKPPLAYDLTELQRDANTMLGFSAKETLDTLQRLYEVHKIVTYPRTDSRYITDDIVPTLTDRILALTATEFAPLCANLVRTGIRKDLSRLVNNELVSDHHALLPTEQKVDVSKLSREEKLLWELVITRFFEVLSSDYTYNTTTVTIDVQGNRFLARVTTPVESGFKAVRAQVGLKSLSFEEDEQPVLLTLKEGMELPVLSAELKKNATMPPDRYTEADLLYAMEHAGKFVEDEELKAHLGNGLGTPATRADIIEKLISSSCIERQGQQLVPTAKGRELVRLVPKQLKSPTLTGQWEQRLFGISNGTDSMDDFVRAIKQNATDLVEQVKANHDSFDPSLMGDSKKLCPSCGWPMVKVIDEFDRVHYVCQRFSCGYEEMQKRQVVGTKVLVAKTVVKESHYRPRNAVYTRPQTESVGTRQSFGRKPFEEQSFGRQSESHDEGGTFADFIKASQDRKKRDEERRARR